MSIATTRGDGGQTGLAGGIRVSKASLRVDTYGTTDELKTVLGLARSLSDDAEVNAWTTAIQRTLFRVGSALATPPESSKQPPIITQDDIDILDGMLQQVGLRNEQASPAAAAFDVARAVCLRAERNVIRFVESGAAVQPDLLVWLHRLGDVLGHLQRRLGTTESRDA